MLIPTLTAIGGATAGVARLDTSVLDVLEYMEGREAHTVGTCALPKQ